MGGRRVRFCWDCACARRARMALHVGARAGAGAGVGAGMPQRRMQCRVTLPGRSWGAGGTAPARTHPATAQRAGTAGRVMAPPPPPPPHLPGTAAARASTVLPSWAAGQLGSVTPCMCVQILGPGRSQAGGGGSGGGAARRAGKLVGQPPPPPPSARAIAARAHPKPHLLPPTLHMRGCVRGTPQIPVPQAGRPAPTNLCPPRRVTRRPPAPGR
jgi:hypothetical protein